jgi:hypothetical protein
MNTTTSSHMSGWTWLAIVGFMLFAVGLINPITLRGTFFHKDGIIKPAIANALLGVGAILIVVGLVLRAP